MKTIKQQEQDTLKAGKSQQLELPLGVTYLIPEGEPVRLLWEVMEEMDFTAYEKENTTWSTQEQFAIWVLGMMNGIYSSRKLEESCRNDIRFMWLLGGKRAPDHSSLSRFRQKVLPELLEAVFPQQQEYLVSLGETDYKTVYIDGTKLEANANRYRFVWRKSIENYLERVKEKAAVICPGADRRAQLEEQVCHLRAEMTLQKISWVSGPGHRKHELQRLAEEAASLSDRWKGYEKQLSIMGTGRNSYAKTDTDATFMRMKEDHMRNGQLKPGYNIQLAVNSEYITGYHVSSDRTDSATLIPLLEKMRQQHRHNYKSVTADAGYESLENYTYLQENGQMSFIKPSNYEQRKKKSNWVGRMQDMAYDSHTDSFTCQNGKTLSFAYKGKQKSNTGFESEYSLYKCTDCSDCSLRQRCSRSAQLESKHLKVSWGFVQSRETSLENITSPKGIQYRINRSIQSEGTFGVLKQDWGFRRFLTRGNTNIQTQIGLLAFAFNVKKLLSKRKKGRTGSHLFLLSSA